MASEKPMKSKIRDVIYQTYDTQDQDTLDEIQFKRAIVRDYLLSCNAYAFINNSRNKIKSIHYVDWDKVTINENFDPIFKDYNILVQGNTYKPFEFLKITKATKDGAKGTGII